MTDAAHLPSYFVRDEQDLWDHRCGRVSARRGQSSARLATSIGLERYVAATHRSREDGPKRFVVDEQTVLGWTSTLGGSLADSVEKPLMLHISRWVVESRGAARAVRSSATIPLMLRVGRCRARACQEMRERRVVRL